MKTIFKSKKPKRNYTPKIPEWKIIFLAVMYVASSRTYRDIEKEYGVSRSSLTDYFNIALPKLDKKLAKYVANKLNVMIDKKTKEPYEPDATLVEKFKKAGTIKTFEKIYKKNGQRDRTNKNKTFAELIWG